MAQDVIVSIASSHSKIHRAGRIPLIVHFLNVVFSIKNGKAYRPLVGPMARIAMNSNLAHASP